MAPKKPDNSSDSPTKKLVRGPLPYVILAMAVLWILVSFSIRGPAPHKMDMTQFQAAVDLLKQADGRSVPAVVYAPDDLDPEDDRRLRLARVLRPRP